MVSLRMQAYSLGKHQLLNINHSKIHNKIKEVWGFLLLLLPVSVWLIVVGWLVWFYIVQIIYALFSSFPISGKIKNEKLGPLCQWERQLMVPQNVQDCGSNQSHKLQVGHSIVLRHLQGNEMSSSKIAAITKENTGGISCRILCTYREYHYSPMYSHCLVLLQN